MGKSSENQVEVTFVVKDISICKDVFQVVPWRVGIVLSLEPLTNAEDSVNPHNTLILVYCAFPGNSHNWLSPSPTSFIFSWRLYLRWWLQAFWQATQFSWVSPTYPGGIHVIQLFLLLICLLLRGCLSQEPRRRVEGKLLPFPPTIPYSLGV